MLIKFSNDLLAYLASELSATSACKTIKRIRRGEIYCLLAYLLVRSACCDGQLEGSSLNWNEFGRADRISFSIESNGRCLGNEMLKS